MKKSSVGTRVGGADFNYRAGRSVLRDTRVLMVEKGSSMQAYTHGPILYKFAVDDLASEVKKDGGWSKGSGLCPGGRIIQDVEKVSVFFLPRQQLYVVVKKKKTIFIFQISVKMISQRSTCIILV